MARFDSGIRYDSGVLYDSPPAPPPATRRKTMAKVKLELDGKNPQEVLAASTAHMAAMATPEGQALFPNPEPSDAEYQALHAALAAGINLLTSLEGQVIAARNALPGLVEDLKGGMEGRAVYVEQSTDGSPAKIPVSGFAVAGTPGVPIGPLPRPENMKAVMNAHPGTVRTSGEPVRGAQLYVVECRLHDEPGQAWQQAKLSTKTRNDIPGLISGKNYAFRMAAVGAAGQSPWSDEAVCMAP